MFSENGKYSETEIRVPVLPPRLMVDSTDFFCNYESHMKRNDLKGISGFVVVINIF
jgi:hypothetical protein